MRASTTSTPTTSPPSTSSSQRATNPRSRGASPHRWTGTARPKAFSQGCAGVGHPAGTIRSGSFYKTFHQESGRPYSEVVTSKYVERRLVASRAVVASLAVPARLSILNHLMSTGPQTASECAAVVGQSPSNCSWHLRELAKVGLVERDDEAEDRRTKPWRATVTGIELGPAEGPADAIAQSAVKLISVHEAHALLIDYLDQEHRVPTAWSDAVTLHDYAVLLTPAELVDLGRRIDDVVRPYLRPTRREVPDGSEVVRVSVRAFLDPRLTSTDQ
ncbi:helix-turn-helix domain-containing protein [Arthrobacter sp. MDT1-65]